MRPPRLHGLSLRRKLTLALIVKAALLYGLWLAFFSTPPARHMHMAPALVEQHLLASTDAHPNATPAPARIPATIPATIPAHPLPPKGE